MNPSYIRDLLSHYQRIWKSEARVCLFDKGPTHQLPLHFVVAEFSPTHEHSMWTYATCGMSDQTSSTPVELHLFSPSQTELHVELLTAIAHYHHTEKHLGLWDTVNFGRPWLPGSACDHGLISLPYLDGPALEEPNGIASRCLWMIPVTKAEVVFKKAHGVEALETRLEAAHFDYLEIGRRSVI